MADFPTDGSGGTGDDGDWTAEELAAQFHDKQAARASGSAETDGDGVRPD